MRRSVPIALLSVAYAALLSNGAAADTVTRPIQAMGNTDVFVVAYSPDGSIVLAACEYDGAYLLDAATGQKLHWLYDDDEPIPLGAAFSPDGDRILIGGNASNGKPTILWDVATGTQLRKYQGMAVPVTFMPDGQRVLTVNGGNGILWRLSDGAQLRVYSMGSNLVAVSPDYQTLAYVRSRQVHFMDIETATPGFSFEAEPYVLWTISCLAYSPDGNQLLVESRTGANLWDISEGGAEYVRSFAKQGYTTSLSFFPPDGTTIAMGTDRTVEASVEVYDTASGAWLRTVAEHDDQIASVALSPDGKRLVTGSEGTAVAWDADSETSPVVTLLEGGNEASIEATAFTPDGERIVSASAGAKALIVWQAETGIQLKTYGDLVSPVTSLAISPDGTTALCGSWGGVCWWAIDTGELLRWINTPSDVVDVEFQPPDGTRAVTLTSDGAAILWDLQTGAQVSVIQGVGSGVLYSASFSPDGSRLLACSKQGWARVWDTADWDVLFTIENLDSDVGRFYSARFSPSGSRIVTTSASVCIWDADTGGLLRYRRFKDLKFDSAEYTQKGARLLVRSVWEYPVLLDAATLAPVRIYNWVGYPVAASPDGSRIATGWRSKVLLWDAAAPISDGSVVVSITPQEAVQDGARWRVDDGDWLLPDQYAEGLSVGSHIVTFSSLDGWTPPKSQSVSVVAGKGAEVNGVYKFGSDPGPTEETYTLTYTAGEGGSISGPTPQTVARGGSGAAVTAVPDVDYAFSRWSDGSTANPRVDANIVADITVRANFVYGGEAVSACGESGKLSYACCGCVLWAAGETYRRRRRQR